MMNRRNETLLMKRIFKNQAWIWIAIILGFIGASLFGSQNQLDEYPLYVSHSPSPTGTKALYTYLDEQGYPVDQWTKDPEMLLDQTENEQLLLMIEPMFIPSGEKMTLYEQFMEAGNTILLFSNHPKDYFDIETSIAMDIFTELEEGNENDEEEFGVTYDDETYETNTMPLERLVTEEEDEVLAYDNLGTYAFKRPYGEGNLIVVNESQWLQNGIILEADHAELVLSLIEDISHDKQALLFDEFIHESEHATTYLGTYPFWFLVVVFQGIIVGLIWIFLKGKRFGPIFTPREHSIRFSDEGITALASWYMRGKRYQDSLRIQADYLRHVLREHWGISYRLSWKEIIPALKRKWKYPPKDIEELVSELEMILASESMKKRQYVQWSKILEQLRKEVEEG